MLAASGMHAILRLSAGMGMAVLLGMAAGCGSDGPSADSGPTASADMALRQLAAQAGMSGDPLQGRSVRSIEDPLARLGRSLFFSTALSGELDVACASCHHPLLGGGDALSLPVGVRAERPELLGPGRRPSAAAGGGTEVLFDGGPPVPRNSPTTFNTALWTRTLFWDGRIEVLDSAGTRTPDSPFGAPDPAVAGRTLLDAQARFPVTSVVEMRAGFLAGVSNHDLRAGLVARLVDQSLPNSWVGDFQQVFGGPLEAADLITIDNVAAALAAYQESQVFIDNAWFRFLAGDDAAIPPAAKRGAMLFLRPVGEGGAGCAACHRGDFFTDEDFHVLAMPQIGRGKGDGPTGDGDLGRFRETGDQRDRFAFRTPSLLNVAVTGPYGHSGSFESLRDVVVHHLDPARSVATFDYTLSHLRQSGLQSTNALANTQAALAHLDELMADNGSKLMPASLTDAQIEDVLAFLDALTDPCVTQPACLAPWLPSRGDGGPDGLRLQPVDAAGQPL
jgi:cytochrome c peroxidase